MDLRPKTGSHLKVLRAELRAKELEVNVTK